MGVALEASYCRDHREIDRAPVDRVETGERRVHRVVDLRPLPRVGDLRQSGRGRHPALDVLHEEERPADHGLVLAEVQHARHGHARVLERLHHPELALHEVRRGEQPARRLLAEHPHRVPDANPERGVGLAPVVLLDDEVVAGPGQPVLHEVGRQPGLVEAMCLRDGTGDRHFGWCLSRICA